MRVKIIKDVPGYRLGTSYPMSTESALYMIAAGEAEGMTPEEHAAAWRAIESRHVNVLDAAEDVKADVRIVSQKRKTKKAGKKK